MLRFAMKKLILLGFLTGGLAMPLDNFGMQFFNALKEKIYPIDTRRVGTVLGRFQGCSPYVIHDIAQKLPDEDVVHWMNTSSAFRSILQDELIERWGLSWYWRENKFTFVPLDPLLPDGRKPRGSKSITFSPAGNYIITNSASLLLRLKPHVMWKLEESDALGEKFHAKYVETSAEIITKLHPKPGEYVFSPDGQLIADSRDCEISLWNGKTGEVIDTIDCGSDDNPNICLTDLVFSPDSQFLAIGYSDDCIEIWDLLKHEVKSTVQNACCWIRAIKFLYGGGIFVSLFWDFDYHNSRRYSRIKFWNVEDGNQIFELESPEKDVLSMDVSPDGTKLVVAGGEHGRKGQVWLWDISGIDKKSKSNCVNCQPIRLYQSDDSVHSAIFSPDGTIVAFASRDEIILKEVSTNKIIQRLPGTGDLAFSSDGKMLAANYKDNVGLWQVPQRYHDEDFLKTE